MGIEALGSCGSVDTCGWDSDHDSEDEKIDFRINLLCLAVMARRAETNNTFVMRGCPGTVTIDAKYDAPGPEDINGPDDSYVNDHGDLVRDA